MNGWMMWILYECVYKVSERKCGVD